MQTKANHTHSPIGASSMHRWQNCPGSRRLSHGLSTVTTEAAKQGTLAHELAEQVFAGIADVTNVDAEMLAAVELYVDTVRKDTENANYVGHEIAFDLGKLHPALYGTCDSVAYWHDEKLLRIYDFKYGKTNVPVENNSQLLYYALGAVFELGFIVDKVELVVVQPRCGGIKRWFFDAFPTLLEFAVELKTAAEMTEVDTAPLVPGDWCFWCPATFICPAKHAEKNKKCLEIFDEIDF